MSLWSLIVVAAAPANVLAFAGAPSCNVATSRERHRVTRVSREWEQVGWRILFDHLLDYTGDDWADDILLPWVEGVAELSAELHQIGAPDSRRIPVDRGPRGFSYLWGLYALSRVLDVLISPFQEVNDDPDILNWVPRPRRPWWEGRIPSRDAYPRFMDAMGCTRIAEHRFHPFFHEIVEVEPADDPDDPCELVGEIWPGYLVGSMLLVRAGVSVRAGAHVLDPAVATRSALYWAWWRRHRIAVDLSHGWGGNSQWGTEFRRDYVVGDELHYNVDHSGPPKHSFTEKLPPADQLSLLRFRCSTIIDFGRDQWPFDENYVEERRP